MDIDGKTVSVAVVGEGTPFRIFTAEETEAVLRQVNPDRMEQDA
jgi:hypothetical protein